MSTVQTLFDPPAASVDREDVLKRLATSVEALIPWASYGASRHPHSSHAYGTVRRAYAALATAGYQRNHEVDIESIEAAELDELRANYGRLIDVSNEMRMKLLRASELATAICQCRAAQGEDDHRLLRELETICK